MPAIMRTMMQAMVQAIGKDEDRTEKKRERKEGKKSERKEGEKRMAEQEKERKIETETETEALYRSKLVTAEEALRHIKSGDRVGVGHAMAEPSYLLEEMVRLKERYRNVEITGLVPAKAPYAAEGLSEHFVSKMLFLGAPTRKAVERGDGEFVPCFFKDAPRTYREDLPIDVGLVTVTPPDRHGYCSLGISCDFTKTFAEHAKIVIAQVNRYMPRTHGDSFIHISEIDYMVEHHEPLIELPPPTITEVESRIGKHIASMVRDGDCLQLGIGAIPDAALLFMTDKKDLGIHSEMISDGVMKLMKAGVINNKRKTLHPGKTVVTFLMGTRELYDFVDDNPSFLLYPVDYVNDPRVIMQNDNMVCINSCIEVDLQGQVVSGSIGLRQFSGVGGQVDFVRGALWSKGGRNIIAMPSTAAKGTVSKITPFITHGSSVTTSVNDVDYVVTEYGIAKLGAKSLPERAIALINIAHPNFRESLAQEFRRRYGYLPEYKKD